jgi:anti-anti-sigma factor
MSGKAIGERLVLCPLEPLVEGGFAEALERHLSQLYRSGYRRLVVDLSNVPAIDSAGVRALVRAQATAARMNSTLQLAGAPPDVLRMLALTNLANVLDLSESPDAASAALPPRTTRLIAGTMLAAALGSAIAWVGSSAWRRRRRS